MGMHDNIHIDCPHCGQLVEIQSKAGDCTLEDYSLNSVPVEIANDLMKYKKEFTCEDCEGKGVLMHPGIIPERVQLMAIKRC